METRGPVKNVAGGRVSSPHLVGRDRELEVLVETVAGPPAIAFVEGEAGVGKSRLVAEMAKRMAERGGPMSIHVGRCHPQPDPFPLEPMIEAVRDVGSRLEANLLAPVVGALRPLLPELAHVLPPMPDPAPGEGEEAHQVFRAFRDLLASLGPTMLVLEDLHWADRTTVELLHFLVTSPPPQLSLVLTYRREDLPASSPLNSLASRLPPHMAHARVALSPLDLEGVAALVAAILDLDEVTDEFTLFLHRRTGGVPFAIEEVLRLLQDRWDLIHQDGRWARRAVERMEVPVAIRDAILERFARLPDDGQGLLRALAVLAEPAADHFVGQLAGLADEALAAALSEALQSALVHEVSEGLLVFRHDLARQAVYDAIPAPERRRLHARAADLLGKAETGPAVRLAHHYREARRRSDYLRHAERAAEEAMARFDEAGACRILYDLLSESSLSATQRVRLARKLGRAALACRAEQESAEVLRGVLDAEQVPEETRAELRFLLGRALLHMGEVPEGLAHMAASLPALSGDAALATQAMISLATPAEPSGHLRDHLGWLEKAKALAASGGDAATQSVVAVHEAVLLAYVGDPAGWEAAERAVEAGATALDARTAARWAAHLAKSAAFLGHYRRAEEWVARGEALCNEAEFAQPLAVLRATRLLVEWATGRWEGLEARASALVEEFGESPHHGPIAMLVLNLALLYRQGDDEAPQGLRKTSALALQRGLLPVFAAAGGGLARCHLVAGEPDTAVGAGMEVMEILRGKGIWGWGAEAAPAVVGALLALSRPTEAEDIVAEFEAGLSAVDAPAAAAALSTCRALVMEAGGEVEQAAAGFAAAREAWAGLPQPYESALCDARCGFLLLDREDAGGLERVVASIEAFSQLGAAPDIARIRDELKHRGIRLPYPWRGGRPKLGNELSEREQEVLTLAEDGRSVRDIARALFLSPSTVEKHLYRARQKQASR